MFARPKWWLSALGAAGAVGLGFAAASVGRADIGHRPGPDAKAGEYTFILHNIFVRPYVINAASRKSFDYAYGDGADPSLPPGQVIVVTDTRAIGESRQLFISGPLPFTRTKGERLEIEQRVYHATDCTPYDRVFVQLEAYLIPDGKTLPAPVAALVRRGGLVAEGNGQNAVSVRAELAALGRNPDVIPLGHYGGSFGDPATDPEGADHHLSGTISPLLRARTQLELTNQYDIGGPCGSKLTTATAPAATTTAPSGGKRGATRCSYTAYDFHVRPAPPGGGYSTSEKVITLSYDISHVSYELIDSATDAVAGPHPFPGETWSVTTAEQQGPRAYRIVVTVKNPGSTTASGEKLWRLVLVFDRHGACAK